jgi:thiol-disulfide isomerase/thioredoxin
MKYLSIFHVTLLFLVFSCDQKGSFNPRITVAGQLENPEVDEIEVFIGDEMSSFDIHEDGSFLIQFQADDPKTYAFRADRIFFSLFLSPGDSIQVITNAKDFKNTFKLSGDKVLENTYLFEKSNFYYDSNMMGLLEQDKMTYFEGKDKFFSQQKERFEKLIGEYEINPDFLKMEVAYFEFEPLMFDIQYPNYQAYFNEISVEEVDFPREETKSKLAQIDLGRADLLNVRSYTSIIDFIISEKASEIISQDSLLKEASDAYEKATFLAIENLLKNQSVKDYFHYMQVKSKLDYQGPVHAKSAIDKFMVENKSPKMEDQLIKAMDKWTPIMPGEEVPDFSFVNAAGDEVKLSDLRGTLVYIDIWATWCKPCIAEHPYWDQLKEEYEGKPVSFLTISIDDNKEAWIKMVEDKNMGGLQWLAENAWRSEITKHFMVYSIPRFFLLDQEGKIIDPSADRPSGNIRATLDQFL